MVGEQLWGMGQHLNDSRDGVEGGGRSVLQPQEGAGRLLWTSGTERRLGITPATASKTAGTTSQRSPALF